MKKVLLLFSFLILFSCTEKNIPLNVMSFNIRYNNPNDGENAWPNRKDKAASMIKFHKADIVGMQEVLKDQLDDLTALLPEYGWYGLGRDDGKEAGEFMAVFYREERLEALEYSTFWLSETPEKVSMGWDAACFRTITVIKFKDRLTNNIFYFFNTHFDHRGQTARRESSLLLLKKISEIAGHIPVIVTGDFNAVPSSEPYKILTTGNIESGLIPLKDTRHLSEISHHGPTGSFTGFTNPVTPGAQIDFIFVKDKVRVLRHGILSDTFDGFYPSDHLPVLVEVVIE
ncbi:endonuclease/exonuclease/phosphatase family protein [candidate division KSB1 bacterium]